VTKYRPRVHENARKLKNRREVEIAEKNGELTMVAGEGWSDQDRGAGKAPARGWEA